MIALPNYIDPEAWDAFMEQKADGLRKKGRKITVAMEKLILGRLQEIKNRRLDPNKALLYSMNKGYDSVYADPEDTAAGESTADYDARRATEAALEKARISKPPAAIKDLVARMRP